VLVKWLPIVQAAMPHGGENALPVRNNAYADPDLLVPALRKGVTVIAAHCGTRAHPLQRDYVPAFLRLVREHATLYGDTAMLNHPFRSYAYNPLLRDDVTRGRLVHGSDWPLPPLPPRRAGWLRSARLLLGESNWMRRDVPAKQALGLDDDYWRRGAGLLRLPAAECRQVS
jgi:predicted TIM-barrel fold metal-dependent hydrolase